MLILFGDGRQIVKTGRQPKNNTSRKSYEKLYFFSMFFTINLISRWILNVLLSLWKHESTCNISCPSASMEDGENNSFFCLFQGGGFIVENFGGRCRLYGMISFFGLWVGGHLGCNSACPSEGKSTCSFY